MSQETIAPVTEQLLPGPPLPAPIVRVFGELRFHSDGDLLALAFLTGNRLCSVEEPGIVRQWDVTTGQPLESFYPSDLETLWAFGPGAKVLLSASDDVSLWDVADGRLLSLIRPSSWVTAVALRDTPAVVATGHDNGAVCLWEASGRPLRELTGPEEPVSVLAFSPDGGRLAAAGEDRIIRIWEVATGRLLGSLLRHSDRIDDLAWHPEGRFLVSGGWDRTARVWDTTTFEPVILLNTHAEQVTALAFHPDGTLLACADSANTIHIWEPLAGKELHVLNGHQDEIRCLAFSPDGRFLASGGADRVIYFWEPREGRPLSSPGRPVAPRSHLVLSPDGRQLTSTCGGLELRRWETASGESGVRPEDPSQIEVLAGSPDGRWLAGGGKDNKVYLWEAASGQLRGVLEGQAGRVGALAFSPDSALVASASVTDGTVWLWDVVAREPVLVIPVAADACSVETLAFHPEGRLLAVGGIDWLATGGSDGAVCLWDIRERQAVATLYRGTTMLAFHPAGHQLAAASLRDSVCVWDVTTQELIFELTGHAADVTCVAYSPDGQWLASGSDDRTIRFWNTATGELAAVQELDTPLKALRFSPDGRFLFTSNGNTTSYQLETGLGIG